jgi:hypothetical protein
MTREPDEIRDGIEQTQRELSADVDALTEKLSPQRVMQRQAERARTVISSMKDRVKTTVAPAASAASGTAGPAASSATSTLSSATSAAARTAGSLPDAARRGIQANPVPTGLAAFAVGWLIATQLPPRR